MHILQVYSFLTLKGGVRFDLGCSFREKDIVTAMRVTNTCRLMRNDMEQAFWSQIKFQHWIQRDSIVSVCLAPDLYQSWVPSCTWS